MAGTMGTRASYSPVPVQRSAQVCARTHKEDLLRVLSHEESKRRRVFERWEQDGGSGELSASLLLKGFPVANESLCLRRARNTPALSIHLVEVNRSK